MTIADGDKAQRRRVILALLLALMGIVVFLSRGYHDERLALKFRDFKQPYSSARCLVKGCDPYNESSTRAVFLAAHGQDSDSVVFEPYSALYPPFSLAALVPVAALEYPEAHVLWEFLIAATFSAAVLLTADLCALAGSVALPVTLLAVFTASSTILIMLGQISGLVIALLAIGFACVARAGFASRPAWLPSPVYAWVAGICFCVAVLLKPHDAAIPLLYLLFAGRTWRRVFAVILIVSLVFAGASLAWFAHMPQTAHWLPELRANLHGNAMPGGPNSPRPDQIGGLEQAGLQSIFAIFIATPGIYNLAAIAASLMFLAAWLVPMIRLRDGLRKHTLAVAAIACLALMPVYHRQYDSRMLLLVFPAIAILLAQRRDRGWGLAALGLAAVATVVTSHNFLHILERHESRILHASTLQTLVMYRPIAVSMVLLFLFFLGMLFREMREQAQS
jgi:hypothetical protein